MLTGPKGGGLVFSCFQGRQLGRRSAAPERLGCRFAFPLRARRAAMCRLLGTLRSHRPTHHAAPTLLLLLGALAFATPALAYPGRWTPTTPLSGTAVHLSLLRGDGNPYFARVVWWQGDDRVGN